MKAFANPPYMVKTVFTAILILMDLPTKDLDTWKESKKLLNNPANFLNQLVNYDKDKVSKKTLMKVKKITNDPEFTPESAANKSKALKSIVEWVLALVEYSEQMNTVKEM